VIRKLKKIYPGKKLKIGHFGTLDPFAEGVLLIGIHGATRIMPYFSELNRKNYLAKGKFGLSSDTLDNTGTIEEHVMKKEDAPSLSDLQEMIKNKFTGKIKQKIPYYSAAKHEGRPLYEWAREGVFVDKDPVEREIYEHETDHYDYPYLDIKVEVSNGTYIRQLFFDIADSFKQKAILTNLIRFRVGQAKVEDSTDLASLQSWDDVLASQTSLDKVLQFKTIELNDDEYTKVFHGNSIGYLGPINGPCWVKYQNQLLCLGLCSDRKLRPKIVWSGT